MAQHHTRLLAGVSVPDTAMIAGAIEYAQRLSEPYLFNHAMRSWLFAAKLGQLKRIDCDLEVVAVGTILHDLGLSASVTGFNRFEVNGRSAGPPRPGPCSSACSWRFCLLRASLWSP